MKILQQFLQIYKEKEVRKRHVIITGTGRAGTTLIVKILTKLGLNTGFSSAEMDSKIFPNCNAGLELDIRKEGAPYIVKSPWICDYIDELIANENLIIDYAIIPIRNMEEAAISRAYVSQNTNEKRFQTKSIVPGGLWGTDNPDEQESILNKKLFDLLLGLSKSNTQVIFINYPMLTTNSLYLYKKLKPILKRISFERFEKAYNTILNLELVHDFKRKTNLSDSNLNDI